MSAVFRSGKAEPITDTKGSGAVGGGFTTSGVSNVGLGFGTGAAGGLIGAARRFSGRGAAVSEPRIGSSAVSEAVAAMSDGFRSSLPVWKLRTSNSARQPRFNNKTTRMSLETSGVLFMAWISTQPLTTVPTGPWETTSLTGRSYRFKCRAPTFKFWCGSYLTSVTTPREPGAGLWADAPHPRAQCDRPALPRRKCLAAHPRLRIVAQTPHR